MNKKMMLLALAAVSAVLFALPAVASAGTWHAETATGGSPGSFSGTSVETTELNATSGTNVKCTSVTTSGSFDAGSTTTGTVTFTFHGCTGPFGAHCTSAGQPTGTIVTTLLPFHLVHLEADKTKPGILITPNAGHFATFSCLGISTVVSGNGIAGELTSPACGASSTSATFKFQKASNGHQKWNQITTTGTVYDLSSSVGGGALSTSSQDGNGSITFGQSTKVNCT